MRPDQVLNMCATRMLTLLAACLMLVPSSASASFRNALEAYANRDVVAMHAEIDAALQRDNYDGLILFSTTVRVTLSKHASPEWMEQTQREALLKKLSVAAQKSGISSLIYQQLHYSNNKLENDYIKEFQTLARFSYPYASYYLHQSYLWNKKSPKSHLQAVYWLEQAADQGLAFAQLNMAGIYLRLNLSMGVEIYFPFVPKDKVQGIAWLKRAAVSYDRNRSMFKDVGLNVDQMRYFAYEMVQLFASKNNTDFYDLEEAKRWLLLAENSPGTYVNIAAKKLISRNISSNDLVATIQQGGIISSLPTWIAEARQRNYESEPLFTFKFSKTEHGKRHAIEYWLDIYADGRVFIGIPFEDDTTHNRELLHRKSPETIKNFISDLNGLGFADWPATSTPVQCITDDPVPYPCPFKSAYAVLFHDKEQKQVFLQHSTFDAGDNLRNQRIEALHNLVIKYFDHAAIRLITGYSHRHTGTTI